MAFKANERNGSIRKTRFSDPSVPSVFVKYAPPMACGGGGGLPKGIHTERLQDCIETRSTRSKDGKFLEYVFNAITAGEHVDAGGPALGHCIKRIKVISTSKQGVSGRTELPRFPLDVLGTDTYVMDRSGSTLLDKYAFPVVEADECKDIKWKPTGNQKSKKRKADEPPFVFMDKVAYEPGAGWKLHINGNGRGTTIKCFYVEGTKEGTEDDCLTIYQVR